MLLEVEDLQVTFASEQGPVPAVRGVDFNVDQGEVVALVGESGSGKSVSALSLLRLLPPSAVVQSRLMMLDGRNLTAQSEAELRRVRGREIGMVFQEPMSSLNPVFDIGRQISEVLTLHRGLDRNSADAEVIQLLGRVGIPSPERRAKQYPHELSGGMKQRAMLAIALACQPKLLIADEPTTALDVTIQAQILALLKHLQSELSMAVLLITHDFGSGGAVCGTRERHVRGEDRGARQYARLVCGAVSPVYARVARSVAEAGPRARTPGGDPRARAGAVTPAQGLCLRSPLQARDGALPARSTQLDASGPTARRSLLAARGEIGVSEPLLRVRSLRKHFPVRGGVFGKAVGAVKAVDGVSFDIAKGETLGLVGESGCGKTTVGRSILRLIEAEAEELTFAGEDLKAASRARLRELRKQMQIVFQDPYSSLNPRISVGEAVGEPIRAHGLLRGKDVEQRVAELFERVGLPPSYRTRFPHEFSGGQRQRIGIARALALGPSFIVCDEAVSALDISIQAQILNLLRDLQQELGIAYLFVTHSLNVVRHVANRIAVMYLGEIVELADARTLFDAPKHPYTRALISANPLPDPTRPLEPLLLTGEIPSPLDPPKGCRFHPRCPQAFEPCSSVVPLATLLRENGSERLVRCHLYPNAS
ncbi:MAG: ABC transporter ATP-binding protein [Polyangiaceae bacterium]